MGRIILFPLIVIYTFFPTPTLALEWFEENVVKPVSKVVSPVGTAVKKTSEKAGAEETPEGIVSQFAKIDPSQLKAGVEAELRKTYDLNLLKFDFLIEHAKKLNSSAQSIQKNIDKLKTDLKGEAGSLTLGQAIAEKIKSMVSAIMDLIKQISPEKLKQALTDEKVRTEILATLSDDTKKLFFSLVSTHEAIIKDLNAISIKPLITGAQDITKDAENIINAIIGIRDALGTFGIEFANDELKKHFTTVSQDLSMLYITLGRLLAIFPLDFRQFELDLLTSMIFKPGEALHLAQDILKMTDRAKLHTEVLTANIQILTNNAQKLGETINNFNKNIGNRLVSEIKNNPVIVAAIGAGCLVTAGALCVLGFGPAAIYFVNDEIKKNIKTIAGYISNLLPVLENSITHVQSLLYEAPFVMYSFKNRLGVYFVPTNSMGTVDELVARIDALLAHVKELILYLPKGIKI